MSLLIDDERGLLYEFESIRNDLKKLDECGLTILEKRIPDHYLKFLCKVKGVDFEGLRKAIRPSEPEKLRANYMGMFIALEQLYINLPGKSAIPITVIE